jgi:hypothetical protein
MVAEVTDDQVMHDVHITLDVEDIGRVTVEAHTVADAVTVIQAILEPDDIQEDLVITWRAKDTNEKTFIPANTSKYSSRTDWPDNPNIKNGSNPWRQLSGTSWSTRKIQGFRGAGTYPDILRFLHVLCTEQTSME